MRGGRVNPNQTLRPNSFVVAERFNSIQGEGRWTGTPMHFIRLAGCNVGLHDGSQPVQSLKTGMRAAQCCTYDGRTFMCDTDYFHGKAMSFELLANLTIERHIVFTGGEPMLYIAKIIEFINTYPHYDYHIETSGTKLIPPDFNGAWITCAPKHGYIPEVLKQADEIKLLVDPGFKLEDVPREVMEHRLVYVQPVNDELSVNQDNLLLCYDILRRQPQWHLSVQLHKFLNLR
jgi:organic radical activating enzyme